MREKMQILPFMVAALLAMLSSNVSFAAEPADTVFTGGKVYTVNDKQP